MRRWLRGALVCLLTFSLSLDTANACWFARRCRPAPTCRPMRCIPAAAPAAIPVACAPCSGCDPLGCAVGPCGVSVRCGPVVACGRPAVERPCCGAATEDGMPPPQIAAEEVVVPSQPTLASETAAADASLPTLQAVEPAVGVAGAAPLPEVAPAVALGDATADATTPVAPVPAAAPAAEPADQPASVLRAPARGDGDASVEDVVAAEGQAAEPSVAEDPAAGIRAVSPPSGTPAEKSVNLFEEVEAEDPAAGPRDEDLFQDETAPGTVPLPTEPAEPAEPPEDLFETVPAPAKPSEPGVPSTETVPEPAPEPDPFGDVRHEPAEPLRRWVDASGEHATIGRLVGVDEDAVDILKANGRRVVVPLERLSPIDRAYAAAAGTRLAAGHAAPGTIDTAGL